MDKNAIKKYAVWARRELIARVAQRAALYEITEGGFGDSDAQTAHGRVLTDEEKAQRQALVARIRQESYQQVMEEVAYTWFNRFIALRFMEVNGYLPSRVRVFTDENNQFKPQILAEAMNLELDGLDPQKVYAFKNANDDDGLFKYMIIVQCNALSTILPRMFQHISDYTELLFPDNLLREGSVVEQMISAIPEDDWRDAVQIIGWLYQYYNAEKKDEVFAALKKNVKITKENIPAATQLFTPDWIVRYMVENSLGRLWVEGHPNDELKATWKYYLEEAEQEPDVQVQLAEIRKEYAAMTPEEIKCIDPCCGSGHILVYLFDVLMQIYESYGYTTREAVASIVQNNLYGLDIDDRAAQLAYFAVMMKARQYDRRFFSRDIQPHVYAIQNSEPLSTEAWGFLGGEEEIARRLWDAFADAKEYGSLVQPNVTLEELERLEKRVVEIDRVGNYGNLFTDAMNFEVLRTFEPLIELAQALVQKYDVVVTNPPYMGSSGMGAKLADFVKKNYPDSKSDLFAVFIEICGGMTKPNGYQAMITQHAWMFLSSFEKLRDKLLQKDTMNMAHLGARAFDEIGGEVVQTTSFVLRSSRIDGYKGTYCRLVEPTSEQGKEAMFLGGGNLYTAQQSNFSKIPGSPVAYWMNESTLNVYTRGQALGTIAAPRKGNSTSDNNRFLRLWHEVDIRKENFECQELIREETLKRRWFPYNKGGGYRKWYGYNEYMIDWYDDAAAIRAIKTAVIANYQYFMKPGLTWSTVTSGNFSLRKFVHGYIFDNGGCCIFELGNKMDYILGLMNSKVFTYIFGQSNPTINSQSGEVAKFPVIISLNDTIDKTVEQNVTLSKTDWDSFETSWDFKRHPLL